MQKGKQLKIMKKKNFFILLKLMLLKEYQNDPISKLKLGTTQNKFVKRAKSDVGQLYKSSFQPGLRKSMGEYKLNRINEKNVTIIEAGHIEDVISPILSSKQQVVSTSTPSSNAKKKNFFDLRNETPKVKLQIAAKTENLAQNNYSDDFRKIETISSTQATVDSTDKAGYSSVRITKNQGVVKIIKNEEGEELHMQRRKSQKSAFSTNETKISAIEELDRCIAEFESESETSNNKHVLSSSSGSTSVTSSMNSELRETVMAKIASVLVSNATNQVLQRHEALSANNLINQSLEKSEYASENETKVYTQLKSYKSEVKVFNKNGLVTSPLMADSNNNFIQNQNDYDKSEGNKENQAFNPIPPPPPPPPPMPANWSTIGTVSKKIIIPSKTE
jgi:hypothetical protein